MEIDEKIINAMQVEEIKNRDVRDGSIHFRMTSEMGGYVEFSISREEREKEMYAYEWNCPNEGKIFLKELEKYSDNNGLKLIVNNVINVKLETILRQNGYKEYYVQVGEDDIIQCWSSDGR